MHQLEEAWNLNMAEEFNPSYIHVMDKIMMEWFKNMLPDSCVLDIKLTLELMKYTIFVTV